jgi:hypothetical protein
LPGHARRTPHRHWILVAVVALAAAAGSGAGAVIFSAASPPATPAAAGPGYARPRASTMIEVPPGTSLSSIHPAAGSTYAFARRATYAGTLSVTADNVTIRNYGSGRYPVFGRSTEGSDVRMSGSYDRLSNIRLTGHGYQTVPACGSAKTADYEVGVDISGRHDTVHAVLAYGNLYAGVYVERTGSYATISGSDFNGVDSLEPVNPGSGAFGVLLWGDHNTIADDVFDNQITCSPDYGTDGSGVEIYHGSYNLIEHSSGQNDSDFTELGGAGATTNSYVDNTFAAPGQFLVTRGSGDATDGPVHNTILTGNVAHGSVVSYDWRSGDGTLLTMKDNQVASMAQDGGYVNGGGNVIGSR